MGASFSANASNAAGKVKGASRQCVKLVGAGAGKLKAAVQRRQADPRGAQTAAVVHASEDGRLGEEQACAVWALYAGDSEVADLDTARAMLEHTVAAMTEWVLEHALDNCEPHELPRGYKESLKSKDVEKIAASLLAGVGGEGGVVEREAAVRALSGPRFEELLTEHDVHLSAEEEGQSEGGRAGDPGPGGRRPAAGAAAVVPRRPAAATDDDDDKGDEDEPGGGDSADGGFDLCEDAYEIPADKERAANSKSKKNKKKNKGRPTEEQRLAAELHSQFVDSMGDDGGSIL